MNKLKKILLCSTALLGLTGCGNVNSDGVNIFAKVIVGEGEVEKKTIVENVNTEEITIRAIHCKQIGNYFNVNVNFLEPEVADDGTSTPKVEIVAQPNFFDHITVKKSGSRLEIYGSNNEVYQTKEIVVNVYNKNYKDVVLSACKVNLKTSTLFANSSKLTISGATEVTHEAFSSNDFNLYMSGASTYKNLNLAAYNLYADLSGSSYLECANLIGNKSTFELSGASSVKLNGDIDEVKCTASGASTFNSSTLNIKKAVVTLTGASAFKATVSESLKVNASGASLVEYSGNCTVEESLSGASTVKKI